MKKNDITKLDYILFINGIIGRLAIEMGTTPNTSCGIKRFHIQCINLIKIGDVYSDVTE